MKKVYICGDSFSSTDSEYGICWVEMLEKNLNTDATVTNLSSVAASNLLISIQVHEAIKQKADFIIFHGTAVTRSESNVDNVCEGSLLERFQKQHLVSYSIYRPYRSFLTPSDQQLTKDFHTKFFDLDLAIYRDQCLIENSLHRLVDSQTNFLFDQGGFEHTSFGAKTASYFDKYEAYRSAINLWDHGSTVDERPYYHIKDPLIHQEIARYYYNQISLTL